MIRHHRALATLLLVACGSEPLDIINVSPAIACVDADLPTELRIEGVGFGLLTTDAGSAEADTRLPQVELSWVAALPGGLEQADQTRVITSDSGRLRWLNAETLAVDIDAGIGLGPGEWSLSVVNPDGERATADASLILTGSPRLDAVEPESICTDADSVEIRVSGQGFVSTEGGLGSATLAGQQVEVTGLEDCETYGANTVCSSMTLASSGGVALEGLDLSYTNPEPGSCGFIAEDALDGVRAPELLSVAPQGVCGEGGVVTLTGERFEEGAKVYVGGMLVQSATLVDSQTLELVLSSGTPTGLQDIELVQPSGCTDLLAEALAVRSSADIYYLDPASLPEGLGVSGVAYVADAGSPVTAVWLRDPEGSETSIDFEWAEDEPGVLGVSLPDGLSAGAYGLALETEDGCGGSLDGALTVQSTLEIGIDQVEPAQAWTFDYTAVTIEGSGFQDLPRLYLSADGEGSLVDAVRFQDSGRLQAVVPPELAVGAYDLIVVNPDGTVGLLEDAITVVEDAPPELEAVRPLNLSSSDDEIITIQGRDFRDPSVSLVCREDGVETVASATVLDWDYSSIEARTPSSDYTAAVCVVEVENGDGSVGRFASVTVRNPSDNLFGWSASSPLIEPRRAPAAVSARTTSVTRHVYAIGGDSGDEGTPLDTIERADIGIYGDLDSWVDTGRQLPAPRTLASARRVGRFIYLVGGFDGTSAVDTVWRALVLDPLEVPRVRSLALDDGASSGLEAGRWYYRIAAIYDESDPTNPGGEGLGGDPVPVLVTEGAEPARISLRWEEVEDAVGYRVYRSLEPDGASSEVGWVADVDGETTWRDDGGSADGSLVPLEQGDLGEWAELDPLPTARAAACLADATDPALDPERTHLLVAGGFDADDTVLDSIVRMTVTTSSPLEQGTTTWDTLPERLDSPRWACGAYVATDERHTVVDGETWVWFAGGHGESKVEGTVDAGQVLEGGDLDQWQTVDKISPGRAGFGAASASDQLYAFGGQQGTPSASGVSASIEDGDVPDLENWNSLGDSMSEARYLPGLAVESGIMVVIGGETETAAATDSVDLTPF